MLELCRKVAEEVQKTIAPIVGTEKASAVVGSGADGAPTLEIDRTAENAAIRVLKGCGHGVLLVSEEAGTIRIGREPEHICVLDPLDGSQNATHGVPLFAVSVAFARYSPNATLRDIKYALVKNLVSGETFEAQLGMGAKRNGKDISTPKTGDISKAALSVYLNGCNPRRLSALLKKTKPRALGCVALELCYVASGAYAGLVDLRGKLRNIDIAAAKLVLEEAGGITSNELGKELSVSITSVEKIKLIASWNAKMQGELLKLVRR